MINDQSMMFGGGQPDSGFYNNVVRRLQSPERFMSQRHRRGEPITSTSPRIPRTYTNYQHN